MIRELEKPLAWPGKGSRLNVFPSDSSCGGYISAADKELSLLDPHGAVLCHIDQPLDRRNDKGWGPPKVIMMVSFVAKPLGSVFFLIHLYSTRAQCLKRRARAGGSGAMEQTLSGPMNRLFATNAERRLATIS